MVISVWRQGAYWRWYRTETEGQVTSFAGDGLYVVTPNIQPEVILPGSELWHALCVRCATATEAFAALGCSTGVKNFPIIGVCPGYISALKSGTSADGQVCRRRRDAGKTSAYGIKAGCVGATG